MNRTAKVYVWQQDAQRAGLHRQYQPAIPASDCAGKTKASLEYGAKYDVSIDEKGHARLEKLSLDAYNESPVFIDAMEVIKGVWDITQDASLLTRSTVHGITAGFAGSTISGFPGRNWVVFRKIRKVVERNTRTTLTG